MTENAIEIPSKRLRNKISDLRRLIGIHHQIPPSTYRGVAAQAMRGPRAFAGRSPRGHRGPGGGFTAE
jgi:hypothetical protein